MWRPSEEGTCYVGITVGYGYVKCAAYNVDHRIQIEFKPRNEVRKWLSQQ
jgi:hypothetical protein